ncbi:ArsR family transcriptional regulator [Jiangella aurantiaca]|uniref:ArsR family transcriptional regulator n=1 Tax=Jiangella aurantiaca TaxID=2530373 RepID=A0A4R5A4D2_9ACTN|nr:helix-turn-helix domain-containing protein [Jiangella aurantiaca]TDD66375.1 ArsR family transcriptional regulator [Jiangella aurantiaca]
MSDQPPAVPRRELRDPAELRALAHPLRLAILDLLAELGTATATEVSARLNESPANCSWHLRQLARYGYVEEAGTGPGRTRRWRLVLEFRRVDQMSGELERALDAVQDVQLERQVQAIRDWRARRREEPAWAETTVESDCWTWLTAEEAAEFQAAYERLLQEHILPRSRRAHATDRPPGSRPVRVLYWFFPTGPVST